MRGTWFRSKAKEAADYWLGLLEAIVYIAGYFHGFMSAGLAGELTGDHKKLYDSILDVIAGFIVITLVGVLFWLLYGS